MTALLMTLVFIVALVSLLLGILFAVMDWRTRGLRYVGTILLAAATLWVSGWNRWCYDPPGKPKDAELTKNRVAPAFDPAKATSLSLVRKGGQRVTLEKRDGRWQITEPIDFPADPDTVENLLTEIRMLDRDKALSGPRTKAEYGLQKPEVVVSVKGATPGPLTLSLGSKDVTGAKVYLARNDDSDVLVVNQHFREAMDKTVDDLRDRAALRFKSTDVKRVSLTTEAGKPAELVSAKEAGWTLRLGDEKYRQRASNRTAEELVRKLGDLRATRFLADGKGALAKHGLDRGARRIVVDDGKEHALLLGGVCPGQRDERVAGRPRPRPTVFCLRIKEVDALIPKAGDLRDARLVGADPAEVTRIHLEAGDRVVTLVKEGLDWKVTAPKKPPIEKASPTQVEDFIKELRSHTVLTFSPPPPEGLAQVGLEKPRATLKLTSEGGRTESLYLGAVDSDGNYHARRSGEQLVVVIHREAGELIEPSLLRFRDRTLLTFTKQPSEAVEITAITGPLVEHAVYQGGLWRMTTPLKRKASADAVDAMLSVLSQLTAQRFVSDAPHPEHGLATPRRVLTVKLEREDFSDPRSPAKKTESHTLQIGAAAPRGGCYARLQGDRQPVFVLPAAKCKDLMVHLVTRRLADLRTGQVTHIQLSRGGGTEHLERRGRHWGRKDGPRVSSASVESLLTSLASMRATRVVSYGKPGPAHGLLQPALAVTLTLEGKDAEPVIIKVGSPVKEEDRVVGHYAVREGRDVVYLLGLPSVETLRKVKF